MPSPGKGFVALWSPEVVSGTSFAAKCVRSLKADYRIARFFELQPFDQASSADHGDPRLAPGQEHFAPQD